MVENFENSLLILPNLMYKIHKKLFFINIFYYKIIYLLLFTLNKNDEAKGINIS